MIVDRIAEAIIAFFNLDLPVSLLLRKYSKLARTIRIIAQCTEILGKRETMAHNERDPKHYGLAMKQVPK